MPPGDTGIVRFCDYLGTRDQIVTKSDKSQNPISTVLVTVELGIGKTVTKCNKSQNPVVTESDKHCTTHERRDLRCCYCRGEHLSFVVSPFSVFSSLFLAAVSGLLYMTRVGASSLSLSTSEPFIPALSLSQGGVNGQKSLFSARSRPSSLV